MTSRWCAALAAVWLAGTALPAGAAAPTDQATKRWKQSDACIADANKQVPDHNEAALRKRDTLVDACFKAHGLPPRSGLTPSDETKPPVPDKAPPG
ncbi:MAG TPA: hypothetical protein VGV37_06895 [Aliidongia sp.]|uniref:hypothetical protein n=1 Tax=Aliidongia sp. TaxID=1914230 RepID=UPI002DDDBA7E|nr:hypothetical protein [Aliidongia sp.]HEV2674253.1 hypothetical protein [Aliidongia sp.]